MNSRIAHAINRWYKYCFSTRLIEPVGGQLIAIRLRATIRDGEISKVNCCFEIPNIDEQKLTPKLKMELQEVHERLWVWAQSMHVLMISGCEQNLHLFYIRAPKIFYPLAQNPDDDYQLIGKEPLLLLIHPPNDPAPALTVSDSPVNRMISHQTPPFFGNN